MFSRNLCRLAALFCLVATQPAFAQFDTLFESKTSLPPGAAVMPLITPPEYFSQDGRLDVTLEARVQRVMVGKFSIVAATYNGSYGGPVLHVKPGDILHIHLINHLAQGTNIHFHGLSVSPGGHADNAMYTVPPGRTWDYIVPIPADHNPGLYWYHSHAHHMAQEQVMAGLSGMLVIDGSADRQPELKPLKERLMALKEFQFDGKGRLYRVLKAYHNDIESINGQLMPHIDMAGGETQVWRLSNQTANMFFRLTLQNHSFRVIGRDSMPLVHPETVTQLVFGPSERVDVLVDGGAPGTYTLRSERTLTGPIGDEFPGQNLAQVIVAAPPPGIMPPSLTQIRPLYYDGKDLSGAKIDATRRVVFSSDDATGLFFINHQIFNHDRIDFRVPLGNVEEWTIRNSADELHIFHIHQVPFQVMTLNGQPVPFNGLVDTIAVPINGEVKIRLAFTDPRIVGQFMFHCHILEHEDKGMMGMIEVYDPAHPAPPRGHGMSGQMTMSADDMQAMGYVPAVAQGAAPPTAMTALSTPQSQVQLDNDSLPGTVGDWPKFGSEATVNLEYDHLSSKGQPNGEALNIQANQQFLMEFDDHWSVSTLLTLQPLDQLELGRNRVLGHEALFAQELFARWNNQKVNIRAGKFDQNFARAWYLAPGLYAQDFVKDYAIGETLSVDAQIQLGSVRRGLHTITISSFMADRTLLSDSLITRRGPLHHSDGGPANTRGPANFVVTYDASYVPVYPNWALDYQLSFARLGHGVDGDTPEQRYAASADINMPLGGGSVERTLRGRFDELRFLGEVVRIDNQGGLAGHRADYQTISSQLAHGQWVLDVSGTLRQTRADGMQTWHDNLQSGAIGYNLPSDTVIAIGAAREHAQGATGFYIGLSLAQVFTTCDRCLIRARHY